jgi:hypothetical protein
MKQEDSSSSEVIFSGSNSKERRTGRKSAGKEIFQ